MRHVTKRRKLATKPAVVLPARVDEPKVIPTNNSQRNERPKTVVDALYLHFQRWQPEVVENAS